MVVRELAERHDDLPRVEAAAGRRVAVGALAEHGGAQDLVALAVAETDGHHPLCGPNTCQHGQRVRKGGGRGGVVCVCVCVVMVVVVACV